MNASFIWLAAVTGALSLLTPCVFPMIPVTIAYFNQRSAQDESRALTHALLFAAGIIVTFTALGLGLAVLIGAAGLARFAAEPLVNITIGIFFLAFALSLLGAYDLPLPFSNRFLNRVDASARKRSGKAVGSVLMGFAFTLASFTCTAPFVGPLLVAAARGDWQQPLLGMAVFSTVFATPFFLLALMPHWTASLPRAGGWLKDVKVVVGLFEIAAALKFFSNADLVWGTGLISREGTLIAWTAIALSAAVYLAWRAIPRRVSPRLIAPLAATGLAFWLGGGVRGASMGELEAFLPPSDIGSFATGDGKTLPLEWIVNDHQQALDTAAKSGQLVFIDFTGYTCTNCRWMEANMFKRPQIREALSKFVLSRMFTDGDGETYENQQKFQEDRFGTVALPLYVIVDSKGRTIRTFSGLTRSPGEFLAFLRSAS